MKRKNLIFVSALLASQSMMAQTPYMNENYMPTDLIGSARYVGMGGALGALGADLSTASSNPAALIFTFRNAPMTPARAANAPTPASVTEFGLPISAIALATDIHS